LNIAVVLFIWDGFAKPTGRKLLYSREAGTKPLLRKFFISQASYTYAGTAEMFVEYKTNAGFKKSDSRGFLQARNNAGQIDRVTKKNVNQKSCRNISNMPENERHPANISLNY
jgi:hypothetical protein